jgi:two-component system, cell cycle sensor histidine kinase and response regulator CckA
MRDEHGKLRGFVKIMRDQTERRDAQAAMTRNEELFRKLVEDVRDYAIYMIDPDGIVTSWNKGAERIKGYRAEEILGKNYSCFYTPEDQANGKPAMERKEAAEKGRFEEIGWRVRKDGAWFWGDEVISSIREKDGTLLGFTKVTRDITERKAAEEAGARQLRHLKAMDEISKVLEENLDLESILQAAMDRILDIFHCDRSYLAQPGYPEEDKVSLPFLASRAEYPGPPNGTTLPMNGFNRGVFEEILKTQGPVAYGEYRTIPGYEEYRRDYCIRSMLVVALKLQTGGTWVLGIHQCSEARIWTEEDRTLFKDVAYRVSGTLNNLLFHRNLRDSEERFRQLAESLPQIVWTALPDGTSDYLNRRWFEYTGMPESEDVQRARRDYIHPDDIEGVVGSWQIQFQSGMPHQSEYRLRNAQGEYRWHLALALPIKDSTGRIWKWVGSLTDVEAQKRNEAELRKSREQLSTILEGINDCIIVQDPDGKVEYLNQAAANLLGFPSPKAVIEAAEGPDAERLRAAIAVTDEEGNPVPPDQSPARLALKGIETPPRLLRYKMNPEAPEKWVINRARPIKDENGGIQFIISILQDITEKRKAEAELRQSQKMEAIGRLAGGIAHDFNNLLTAINGYSELGLGIADGDSQLHSILNEILEAGKRAASLTNQLLAHSRKQILTPKVLDLNETIRNMHSMLKRIIGEDIDLVTSLNKDVNLVKADPGQVEQVIMNLSVNARDAMPKGGKVTIETQVVDLDKAHVGMDEDIPAGRYFMISVSDTGHGMAKAVRDHIFEPFYTTKAIGKGTGLGLSTVYGIVKQSGGFISVYSEPQHGASFKVYFPVVGEGNGHHALQSATPEPLGASNGETIMLVEDEDVVRKLSRSILSELNYKIIEAGNGEKAVELAKSHPGEIHLLLTDVVMNGIGGQELARRIRKLRPGIKVIYMSGYTDDAIVRHGVLESATNFIQKPFSPKVLTRKVREVLAQGVVVAEASKPG